MFEATQVSPLSTLGGVFSVPKVHCLLNVMIVVGLIQMKTRLVVRYTTMFRLRPLVRFFCSQGCTQDAIYLSTKDLAQVVDLDVIKARTDTPSESSAMRDDFRTVLGERDVRCVWTGSVLVDGLHIIPFKRGSEVRPATCCMEASDRLPSG